MHNQFSRINIAFMLWLSSHPLFVTNAMSPRQLMQAECGFVSKHREKRPTWGLPKLDNGNSIVYW